MVLNEGLEALGTDEYPDDDGCWDGVFEGSALESITLPSTLRRIEYSAFKFCERLKAVLLPDGLETIGTSCFAYTGLESIVFPKSMRAVGNSAFCHCRKLKYVELNEELERLGETEADNAHWFKGWVFMETGIESITFPPGLKRIEDGMFRDCESLRSVQLPDRLETIGQHSFQGSGIERVVFPPSVREIESYAFDGCTQLRSVQLNEGLEKLGQKDTNGYGGAVFSSAAIESVVVPSTLKRLEDRTFCGCKSLKTVEIRSGV